jgi:hypothetical protein
MPLYILSDKPPTINPDRGSGPWCSAPQTADMLVYKRAIEFALDTRAVDLAIGADAVLHMRQYLNNTGNDLRLNVAALMQKSKQLREHYTDELRVAKAFCETLPPGRHAISSSKLGAGYFRQSEDTNLYFAIGGYSFWGQGKLNVNSHNRESLREYVLEFEFHFFDRYNWDAGKSVSIAGMKITDDFMQKFHRQCYAREYDVRGLAKDRVTWSSKVAASTAQPAAPMRNPFDLLLQK